MREVLRVMQQPEIKKDIEKLDPDIRIVRERPLFAMALYMITGILAAVYLPALPAAGLLALLGILFSCMTFYALKVNITIPIMLMAFVAGYTLMSAALPRWASDPWAPKGAVAVKGRIAATGTTQGGHAFYMLDDVFLNGKAAEGRVLVTARSVSGQGREGDSLSSTAELTRPEVSRFYGGFNARGYYMRRGIRFTAFVGEPKITPATGGETIFDLPRRARLYSTAVLGRYLSPDSAALVDALLSGNRSGITDDVGNSFIMLGVAHLLAVSGLNISLTAGAAWLLCRKLKLPMMLSLAVSFVVMSSYVLFAGFTPSVERAAVMWIVMMGGLMAARRYDPLSSISVAAVIILALNPLDLFDAGFQLSFAATVAMFLWLAPIMRHAPESRLMRAFAGSVGVTVCVTILALPLILCCFNNVSLISPLANLVLVPSSFVMQLAGTALLFAGFMPDVAAMLGQMLDKYTAFYLHNVSLLNYSAITLPAATPPAWLMAVYVLLVLAVSPPVMRLRPWGRMASIAALAVAAAIMLTPLSASLTKHSDTAVVSEGSSSLSIFWQVNGRRYAACGESWNELSGYLKSRGIARLDGLYVLGSKPPVDGSMLANNAGIIVDRLYVPGRWMQDSAASAFLEEGLMLGMEPSSTAGGPFECLEEAGNSAVLVLPVAGGRLAFAPPGPQPVPAGAKAALEGADVVVLNMGPAKAEKLLGSVSTKAVVLPGTVADVSIRAYNIIDCGSIEIQRNGGALALTSWIGGWADGIQGNFR